MVAVDMEGSEAAVSKNRTMLAGAAAAFYGDEHLDVGVTLVVDGRSGCGYRGWGIVQNITMLVAAAAFHGDEHLDVGLTLVRDGRSGSGYRGWGIHVHLNCKLTTLIKIQVDRLHLTPSSTSSQFTDKT